MNYTSRKPLVPEDRTRHIRTAAPLWRAATALVRFGNRTDFNTLLKQHWPNDANTEWLVERVAVPVGTTTSPTWAQELVGRGIADIISILAPASAGAAAMARGLQFQFSGGFDTVSVPGLLAAKTDASFILQGANIPIRKYDTSKALELAARKIGTIIVFTREVADHSIPNFEKFVSAAVTEGLGLYVDSIMFDNAAGSATRPPGLLNSINATAASGAATALEAMKADIGTLVTAVSVVAGSSPILLIAAPAQAAAIKLWRTGGESAFEVLPSGALAAGTVICLASNCLASAADPAPRFDVSNESALILDDAPTDIIAAGGQPFSGGAVKSMFQTDERGLRVILFTAWGLRDKTGLAWMQNTNW